jgi:hypothetical protein
MAKPKVWFVCAKKTASDIAVGEPFTGQCGRWLFDKCIKPLGLRRKDVGLLALDQEPIQKSIDGLHGNIVIAVGRPAGTALGDVATVTIPHPLAVFGRKDTGETARKMERVLSVLKATEDAQTKWENEWHKFVPPTGGQYTYQKHSRGKAVHYDLRMTSKNDGKLWGFTVVGGEPIGKKVALTVPKAEHSEDWMSMDGTLPNDDTMKILASGEYAVGLCGNKVCEVLLKDLTNEDKHTRLLVTATGKNDSGVLQWVSQIPADQVPVQERKTLAEITGEMRPDERLIYNQELVTAGSVEKMDVRIAKSEDSKHIVYGVVLDPYIVDSQNDWTPPSEVEKVAHNYLKRSRTVGYMHERKDDSSHVVESWVEQYPSHEDYVAAMNNEPHKVTARKFGDDVIHSGTWVMGVKLGNESWEKYKSGELNAFSPGGYGRRKKITRQDMPKIEVINATAT